MGSSRVWVFRGLVAAAAGLMLLSWFMPWWSCHIYELGENMVIIYPYGLSHNLGEYAVFIEGSDMPVWFGPFMWTYLGICIALLLFSLFAKEKAVSLGKFKFSLPQVIIGGVGLSYIVIAVLAVIVAAIRTGDFFGGIPLQGYHYLTGAEGVPWETGVDSTLRFGYWLAHGVGLLCIVLALLRDKIVGKPELSA